MILLCQLPLELHPIYSQAYRKIAFNLRSLSQRAARDCDLSCRVSRLSVDGLSWRRAAPSPTEGEATRNCHTRGPRAQRLDVGRRGMRLRVRRVREP